MNELDRKNTIGRVIAFSVLVTALAWIAPALGGSPSTPGPGFILWGIAPLLVSIIMRATTRDWSDLGIKPALGKNLLWYLASILGFPALMLLTLLVGVVLSLSSLTDFSLGKFLQTFLTALPIFFIFAIFEEVGWRGYLSPKLDALGLNRLAASAIVAVVWATWHLPYIRELTWVYSSEDLATFVPRFYLVCLVLSILFGELRRVTGTVWTAVLIHAVGNAFGHPLAAEYIRYAAGMEFLASISNGLIFVVLAGLLGALIERRRKTNG
jgi:membrane protease YdiL (CAAX protease family)